MCALLFLYLWNAFLAQLQAWAVQSPPSSTSASARSSPLPLGIYSSSSTRPSLSSSSSTTWSSSWPLTHISASAVIPLIYMLHNSKRCINVPVFSVLKTRCLWLLFTLCAAPVAFIRHESHLLKILILIVNIPQKQSSHFRSIYGRSHAVALPLFFFTICQFVLLGKLLETQAWREKTVFLLHL